MNLKAAYAALVTALIVVPVAAFAQTPRGEHSFYTIVAEAKSLEKNVRDIQDQIQKSQIQQRNLMVDFFSNARTANKKEQFRKFEELLERDPGLYPAKVATGYLGTFTASTFMTFREQDRRRLAGIERPDMPALIDLLPLEKYNGKLSDIKHKITNSI